MRPARITASRRAIEAPREPRLQCATCADAAAPGDLLCSVCALALRPRWGAEARAVLERAKSACPDCWEGRLPRWSVACRRWVHDYRRAHETLAETTEQGADVCGADEIWRGAFPR